MRRPRSWARGSRREGGSVVLFVLFVAVALAVLVEVLSVVVIAAERGKEAEDSGRARLHLEEQALREVRERLASTWQPYGWTEGGAVPAGLTVMAAAVDGSGDWVLDGSAADAAGVSPVVLSMWIERGRDGMDLPLSGVVADAITAGEDRQAPCLLYEPGETAAATDGAAATAASPAPCAWLRQAPQPSWLSDEVSAGPLLTAWSLDEGTRQFFGRAAASEPTPGLAVGACASALSGRRGTVVAWPEGAHGTLGSPLLVVVTGGATLDACDLGDVYGVVVVDEGGLRLDGTRLHGGVFVSGDVDFGLAGQVLYSRQVVRWATDRSLVRARLVPGTRREAIP